MQGFPSSTAPKEQPLSSSGSSLVLQSLASAMRRHLFLREHGIIPRLSCLLRTTRPYHSQEQRLRGRVLCWQGPGRGTEISVSKDHAEAFPTGAKCLGLVAKDRRGQRKQEQEPAHSGRRCVYHFLLQPHILDHAAHREWVRAALGISCVPGLASVFPQHLWESRLVTSVLGQRLDRRALWPGHMPDITQKGSG